MMELRPYQRDAVADALAWVATAPPDGRILYACPTGTGKSLVQLELQRQLRAQGRDAWIFTPKLDILRGYLEKRGVDPGECGPDELERLGREHHIMTTRRAHNREIKGRLTPPEVVIMDEGHHAVSGNKTSGLLFAMGVDCRWIGYTATPFRGTPKSTAELEADWPEIVEVLSIEEAVRDGWWAQPRIEVVPLVDDDAIKVSAGQFQVKSATKAVGSRVQAIAELLANRLSLEGDQLNSVGEIVPGEPVRPTAVAIPSREVGYQLVEALDALGVDAAVMQAGTSHPERHRMFEQCRAGQLVIVSVKVISEGLDKPWLRRLLDARPTTSPVEFLQYLGRITRPDLIPPEYLCACRNVERHGYLLGGAIPRGVVKQAQEAFDKPSKRAGQRQVGLEELGRFKAISLPLADGVRATMYILYSVAPSGVTSQWCTIQDPCAAEPIHAMRSIAAKEGEEKRPASAYGRWQRVEGIPDLQGFATQTGWRMTPKQQAWWERSARSRGLDPDAKVTARVFQALPILMDLGVRL